MRKLIVYLFGIVLIVGCNSNAETTSTADHQPQEEMKVGSSDTAIDEVTGFTDPVCMMKISEQAEQRYTHENVTYGFCSAGCKKRFQQQPSEYLAALEE